MDCSQINELLMDYIYQELDHSSVERFEAHLHSCPGCTELISGFEQTRSAFQELPQEDPPAAVSAFLLREAAAAVAPDKEGFWERLRAGLRVMVMHPAMPIATTLVLVLGVSFGIYRQGPLTSNREMIDVPLVQEEHSIAHDRTAAIGMRESEKDEAKEEAPAKDAPAPAQLRAQAPAPMEANYKELAELKNKVGSQGSGGWGKGDQAEPDTETADTRARARRASATSRDNSLAARQVATTSPAAEPAPAPPPASKPRPSSTRTQLFKRNEKASLNMDSLADALGSNEDGAGNLAGGAGGAPAGVVSGTGSMAKAKPARVATPKKPAPARRAKSADKKDDQDTLNVWNRGGGRKMAQVAKPVEPQRADDAEQAAGESMANQPAAVSKSPQKKAAPRPTSVAKSPAPEAQKQSAGPSAQAQQWLQQGHLAAESGACLKAYAYYDQAIGADPSLRTSRALTDRVSRCASTLTQSGDELPLVLAQKKYPRLASMLAPQVKIARRKRIASSEAAEQKKAEQKKTARKKSKAKKAGKKVRSSDKAATSY